MRRHETGRNRGQFPLHALAVTLLVLVSYGGSLSGDFVWDDRPLIVENARVHDAGRLDELLFSSFWETGDRHDRFRSFFRPLVGLSYFVDHTLWGLRPLGFHLTNVVLHLLCCLLVYAIGRDEGLRGGIALAAAALFAVHPVHVESVAWISGRTDVLCAAFVLGAFLLHRRARRASRPAATLVCAMLLFAAALFAKEMAATLPVLIAVDRWLDTRRVGCAFKAAWPFAAALVGYVALRSVLIGSMGQPLFSLDAHVWVATALFVCARYLTLLIMPVGLDAHYPYGPIGSVASGVIVVSAAMLATAGYAAFRLLRRNSCDLFWFFWVPISIVPVLAFGRFGDVILADRFLYLPSVGLCLLAARVFARLLGGAPGPIGRAATAAAMLLVLTLSGWSFARSRVWINDLTLFSDMAETSPDSALVRCNLGLALYRRGDLVGAVREYRAAIEREPTYSVAHNNLAVALERQGRLGAALDAYETALRIAPGHADAGINAGHLLTRMGQPNRGATVLREMVGRHPRHPAALYALAEVLERAGQVDEASSYLERVRNIAPGYPNAHYLTGKIRYDQGRIESAAESMRVFLGLWPHEEDAWTRAARRIIALAETEGRSRPVALDRPPPPR